MIALLTDFGVDDIYVGAMKAAIVDRAPNVPIVDITHAIPQHDIASGSFALASALPYLPEGCVVVAVVDPGVGSDRARLAVSFQSRIVVAPDNGLLTDLTWRYPASDIDVYAIDDAAWAASRPTSATFEGRDVFAPTAAALATGTPLASIGRRLHGGVELLARRQGLHRPMVSGSAAIGHIRHIDHFGNIVTDLRPGILEAADEFAVSFEGARTLTLPFVRTYSDVEVGRLCLLTGSFGYIEIACRNAGASALFPRLRLESPISLKPIGA